MSKNVLIYLLTGEWASMSWDICSEKVITCEWASMPCPSVLYPWDICWAPPPVKATPHPIITSDLSKHSLDINMQVAFICFQEVSNVLPRMFSEKSYSCIHVHCTASSWFSVSPELDVHWQLIADLAKLAFDPKFQLHGGAPTFHQTIYWLPALNYSLTIIANTTRGWCMNKLAKLRRCVTGLKLWVKILRPCFLQKSPELLVCQ